MRFTAYASSSAGNLYGVSESDQTLLIECGLPVGKIKLALNFSLTSCIGCLVSHHHGDHAQAAEALMYAGVDVYASHETWHELGVRGYRSGVLAPRVATEVGPYRVLPFDLRHDAPGALGFLVESPRGDRLLYACDTAYVPYTFSGLTHIAVECNYSREALRQSAVDAERVARVMRYHMGLERVLAMLAANDLSLVREVWLLHLSDHHADARLFRDTVEAATGKPVHIAPRQKRQRRD